MKIKIITDSHSGISKQQSASLGVDMIPMPFTMDGVEYYEDGTIPPKVFFERLDAGARVSTSQASPGKVLEFWDHALRENEQVIYIPMSSGLSSSCATARALAAEKPYRGKVFVVDNGRISTPLYRSVLDALEMAEKGLDGARIQRELERSKADMSIYVAAHTLEHLKRGGRISAASATIGGVLGIRPILHLDVGVLSCYKKARGDKAARQVLLDCMRYDLGNRFQPWYDKKMVHLLAASNADEETTASWICEIQESFPGMPVLYSPLSLGVSCHIGPGVLGVGCSCVPDALIQ